MNAFAALRSALRALAANLLRSMLTMLGIIIGVAAVITLLSVGRSVEEFRPRGAAEVQQAVVAACARGASVVVSNSSAPEILRLYGNREARAVAERSPRSPKRASASRR